MIRKNCVYEIQKRGNTLVVSLSGEIDHHSAVSVRSEIDAAIYEMGPEKTVLDLSNINFMDSSGLGLIMGRYALMQKLGGVLTLKNPNERVVKIFELAGLGRIIKIEKEESEDRE